MRKIHKEIANLISKGFETEDALFKSKGWAKKANKNVKITKRENFKIFTADFYKKEAFFGNFTEKAYLINVRKPFSSTFKGYLNAVLTGLGLFSNANFYTKKYKICNDAVKKDDEGYYLEMLDGSKVRLFFEGSSEAFNDCNFKCDREGV